MRIAVIGAGNVGQALAGSFSGAGHDVTITASSQESAEDAAGEVGVRPEGSNRDAVQEADVVVLAVWYAQHESVASEIADAVAGKVVVDVSNPLTPEMDGLATEGGPSAAERLAKRLPDARVVKAFNTLFASVQADPGVHAITADGFVAGDDADAKGTLMELMESIGVRPVDVGPLRHARLLEALGFLGIHLNAANDWAWNTVWKLVGAPIPDPSEATVGAAER